ncbi:hypothetical protein ACFYO5_37600 [Streptomyces sp. NPDC006259]|uniref:hypothetical protein n=1 Tax=Streptomyces sp. NPDC006259 TaxID=3364740 RepID=UPI0036A8ECD5
MSVRNRRESASAPPGLAVNSRHAAGVAEQIAVDCTEHDEDGSALRVEAKRITHAAERIGKLADTVEEVAE